MRHGELSSLARDRNCVPSIESMNSAKKDYFYFQLQICLIYWEPVSSEPTSWYQMKVVTLTVYRHLFNVLL